MPAIQDISDGRVVKSKSMDLFLKLNKNSKAEDLKSDKGP